MGQNRRHDMISSDIDRCTQRWEQRPSPIGLLHEQVQASGRRQDASEPVPIRAWVPHHVSYTEQLAVDGVALAWTSNAVLIQFTRDGVERTVWVWASCGQAAGVTDTCRISPLP